jgi:hypothetical protein
MGPRARVRGECAPIRSGLAVLAETVTERYALIDRWDDANNAFEVGSRGRLQDEPGQARACVEVAGEWPARLVEAVRAALASPELGRAHRSGRNDSTHIGEQGNAALARRTAASSS